MNLFSTEHIFYHHLLPKKSLVPFIKAHDPQDIWPSVFLFICLILLMTVKQSSVSALYKVVLSAFSFQSLRKFEREESNQFKLYSYTLSLFFILNVTFLACEINAHYHLILRNSHYLAQFLFFFSVIIFVLVYKLAVNRFIIFISKDDKSISEYTSISTAVNQTAGLILFPLMVLIAFSSVYPLFILFTSIITLSGILLLKWGKGLFVGMIEERIGLLQIFTYFCALEILPGLIVVKYIIETF